MQNKEETNKKIDELKNLLCDCGFQTKSPSIKKEKTVTRSRKKSTLSQKEKKIRSTNANTICCRSESGDERLYRYITNPDRNSKHTYKNCMETETVVSEDEAAEIDSCWPSQKKALGKKKKRKKTSKKGGRRKKRTKRRYKKKKRIYKKKRTKKKSRKRS
jgi:hypothetical protein